MVEFESAIEVCVVQIFLFLVSTQATNLQCTYKMSVNTENLKTTTAGPTKEEHYAICIVCAKVTIELAHCKKEFELSKDAESFANQKENQLKFLHDSQRKMPRFETVS